MDKFLSHDNELSTIIQNKAVELYEQLRNLPVQHLGLPDYCLNYYNSSHLWRLFFSIETSARLLYRSIQLTGKPVQEIVIMDYGAGVGTLFLLAKKIGCKVIYNDHLEDWRLSAELIAKGIQVNIDEYEVGDIESTLRSLKEKNISLDIITSRNVVEHIYNLDDFFRTVSIYQPDAIIYSSTTANYYNPATYIIHTRYHRKIEKLYYRQRLEIIRRHAPGLAPNAPLLAKATRGLGGNDLMEAIDTYRTSARLPDPGIHGSNTCDPVTGVWAEHLLTFSQYRELAGPNRYSLDFIPGFWDVHYSRPLKNVLTRFFNSALKLFGRKGFFLAPFIYVVAKPLKNK